MTKLPPLFVPGVPAPQGSKSAFRTGGRTVIVEGSSKVGREKHRAWRTAVTLQAIEWRTTNNVDAPLAGPIKAQITFDLPRPKSAPKSAHWAAKKPDLDKLLRSTLDGLADAGVFVDDAQVVHLSAWKTLSIDGVTGAHIELEVL